MPNQKFQKPFPWNREDPLELIRGKDGYSGETKKSNQALRDYCQMGPARSLRKLSKHYNSEQFSNDTLAKPPTKALRSLNTWSMNYDWVSRAAAWDYMQAKELEKEYVARRLEITELDYKQAVELRKLADKIMEEAPEYVKATEKMVGDTLIITKQIDINALIKLIETGSKLGRLSAGMTSEHKSIQISGDALERLPTTILEQVATGKLTQEELIKILEDQE